MKPLACITLVRNEPFFLPLWVRHYSPVGDLYVLDHETDDGSTDGLPATVEPVSHSECERAAWMMGTVQERMRRLLFEYDRVIYAEVDEFLVPDPERWPDLSAFLRDNPDDFVAAQGWNVLYDPNDPSLDQTSVLRGRKWKREPVYDMTLVARHVPNWRLGRHGMVDRENGSDVGLRLVHLHYLNPELGWERIQARKRGKEFAPDGCGWQNKPSSRQAFDEQWATQCCWQEPIPEPYWNAIR